MAQHWIAHELDRFSGCLLESVCLQVISVCYGQALESVTRNDTGRRGIDKVHAVQLK